MQESPLEHFTEKYRFKYSIYSNIFFITSFFYVSLQKKIPNVFLTNDT